MAYHMSVGLLVAIVGVLVSSTAAYTHPPRRFLENCPRGTIPTGNLFDPAVGKFQLTCKKVPRPVQCVRLGPVSPTQSLRCPQNFVLTGRTPQRQAICCQFEGIATTDCFRPKVLYSLKLGFEVSVPEGFAVVGRFNYGVCTTDPTVFQIKICKLTPKMAYPKSYHMI